MQKQSERRTVFAEWEYLPQVRCNDSQIVTQGRSLPLPAILRWLGVEYSKYEEGKTEILAKDAHSACSGRAAYHLSVDRLGARGTRLTFLAGASYNALVTLRAPALELQGLIALSPLPLFRGIATRAAMPHATLFTGLVILFEASVGLSRLAPAFVRRVAYLGALAFFVVLAPLVSWYGLTNLVSAIPAVMLLRYDRAGGRARGPTSA